jgi:selenocysteine lyase/cysteine desulfurase
VVDWAERNGAPIVSPRGPSASGILCIAPENVRELHRRLKAARIVCSLREGAIRLSPHCYNTVAEVERVAEALVAG